MGTDPKIVTEEMLAAADRIKEREANPVRPGAFPDAPLHISIVAPQESVPEALIDFFTASDAERNAALQAVFLFAERSIRLWALDELLPCWPLHDDVVLSPYHLERAWHYYHHVAATQLAEASTFWRVHLPAARALWRESAMFQCNTHHPETPRWEPANVTVERRDNYLPAPDSYETNWPVNDPGGQPWGGTK